MVLMLKTGSYETALQLAKQARPVIERKAKLALFATGMTEVVKEKGRSELFLLHDGNTDDRCS